jgi:hypothetical protein
MTTGDTTTGDMTTGDTTTGDTTTGDTTTGDTATTSDTMTGTTTGMTTGATTGTASTGSIVYVDWEACESGDDADCDHSGGPAGEACFGGDGAPSICAESCDTQGGGAECPANPNGTGNAPVCIQQGGGSCAIPCETPADDCPDPTMVCENIGGTPYCMWPAP